MAGTAKIGLISIMQELLSASREAQAKDIRERHCMNVNYEEGYQRGLIKLAEELGIKEEVCRCSTSHPTRKA